MYGIEYEDDILLLLRMIKFLHMQSPDAAHIFCQSHPVVDIRYSKYTWNPAYKGVDDYLLSQAATM